MRREKFDFENFLSPASIQKFNNINRENSLKILNSGDDVHIWKGDKIKLSYSIFKEVIDQANSAKAAGKL